MLSRSFGGVENQIHHRQQIGHPELRSLLVRNPSSLPAGKEAITSSSPVLNRLKPLCSLATGMYLSERMETSSKNGVRFHLDVLLRAPILENISSVRHPVSRLNPITTNRFNDMFWNRKTSRVEQSLQQIRVGPVKLNNGILGPSE